MAPEGGVVAMLGDGELASLFGDSLLRKGHCNAVDIRLEVRVHGGLCMAGFCELWLSDGEACGCLEREVAGSRRKRFEVFGEEIWWWCLILKP